MTPPRGAIPRIATLIRFFLTLTVGLLMVDLGHFKMAAV